MPRGVTYFLAGSRRGPQLVVSLFSLRQQWQGDVTVITADDAADEFIKCVANEPRLGVNVISWRPPGRVRGKGGWQTAKTCLPELTPYGRTVYLDCDTLVVGDFTDLFPDGDEVRLTQFSTWKTTGSRVRGRLTGWKKWLPDEVAEMTAKSYPAINTGVFGISKSANLFASAWKEVTHKDPRFMGDEITANLIFPKYPHLILDHRWNFSPVYSLEPSMPPWEEADARIVHFHGWSTCRPNKSQFGCDLWMLNYHHACALNIAGMGDWGPGDDRHLRLYLDGLKTPMAQADTPAKT